MKRKVFFSFLREREREKEVVRKLETEVIINDILGKEGRGEKTGREGKEVPATNISSYFQIEMGSWVLKFGPPPPPPFPLQTQKEGEEEEKGGGRRREYCMHVKRKSRVDRERKREER